MKISALEARDIKTLQLSEVRVKLIEEYERHNVKEDDDEMNGRAFKVNQKKEFKGASSYGNERECYFCHERGHIKRKCKKYRKYINQQWKQLNDSSNESCDEEKVNMCRNHFALNATDKELKGWCVDSGASSHICKDRSSFITFDETIKTKIYLANGKWVTS